MVTSVGVMTRDEFIDGYIARSNLAGKVTRVESGFWLGTHHKIALPCACGDDSCEGWAIISAEGVHDHLILYAPDPLHSAYLEAVGGP